MKTATVEPTSRRSPAKPKARSREGLFTFEESQTIIVQHRPNREQAMKAIRARIGEGTRGADICRDLQEFRDNPRA